jgi:hypothetical protein
MAENNDIDAVMGEIEEKMAVAQLEKRGAMAVCVASIAAMVMREALAGGVPYSLAKEMAEDYWKSEMAPVEVYQLVAGEDE